jgi:hypothetical protein
MKYVVRTFREAGLEARWTKKHGVPIIGVRNPKAKHAHQRYSWWVVDGPMWAAMQRDGILAAFEQHTLLGDLFSVPARSD